MGAPAGRPCGRGRSGARAQAMVEYALILSLVSLSAIAGLTTFGQGVAALFSNLGGSV